MVLTFLQLLTDLTCLILRILESRVKIFNTTRYNYSKIFVFFFLAYLIPCLSNAKKFELLSFVNFETVKFEISFAKSMNLN